MDGKKFKERMSAVDSAYQRSALDTALTEARSLIADLESEPIIEAEQIAWPIFYALKAMHGKEDWKGYTETMNSRGAFLVGSGVKNHAFACSLMMEALYRTEQADEIPKWGAECCHLRVRDGDFESLNMAMSTARNLLSDLERVDLEVAFLESLIDVGKKTEVNQLSVHAQRWALETAASDDELLAAARKRCMERLDDWKALASDMESQVIPFLMEICKEEWFLSLLDPAERKRQELSSKLFEPANAGDVEATLALLDDAGDPNLSDMMGRTALGISAFVAKTELVEALLAREGTNVDHANLQKRTPLAQAADQGHTEIVAKLLAAGASPDIADLNEQTPLILASWQNHIETVKALLTAGPKLDLRDVSGNDALTLAATEDVPDIVVALLDAGADVNATTSLGHTPLMKAAMEGQTKIVEILLERGADMTARDKNGMTAQDWAKQEGHDETAAAFAS
jgi:ankyrin repeat protein